MLKNPKNFHCAKSVDDPPRQSGFLIIKPAHAKNPAPPKWKGRGGRGRGLGWAWAGLGWAGRGLVWAGLVVAGLVWSRSCGRNRFRPVLVPGSSRVSVECETQV